MTEVWDEAFDASQTDIELLGLEDESPSDTLATLLHVGHISKDLDVFGREIRLRTLKMGEELEIGVLIKKYSGTQEEGRAYACAVVASAVVSVDGKPLVQSLGPNDNDALSSRFDFVRKNWYWPVIQEIYEAYILLQEEQVQALEELRKK